MKPLFHKIRQTIQDMDHWLLWTSVMMIIYGLLNIVTASSSEAVTSSAPLYFYFYQQSKMLVVALIGSIVILNIDTKQYPIPAVLAYFGILGLLLYLSLYGTSHRGSINWLQIGPFTFQPSEFSKPVMIVSLAILFEKFYRKLKNKKISHIDMLGIIFIAGFVYPVIIFLQKDLGTAMIVTAIFGVMFLTSPILAREKLVWIGRIAILGVVGCLIMLNVKGYILSPEQMDRFDFFNPCSNYEEGGYQICNGFIAINDGGLLGLGPGKSKQKYSYIPEPHTDSVFAIIVEENGLLLSTLLFIGYYIILKRILLLASIASTIRGRYICIGAATYLFMHILINLGGLFGVMPLTGVPLPFLSYGGSFTISMVMMLAVVQRVHIETKRQKMGIKQ